MSFRTLVTLVVLGAAAVVPGGCGKDETLVPTSTDASADVSVDGVSMGGSGGIGGSGGMLGASLATAQQDLQGVFASGGTYLVTYSDARSGNGEFYATRVSSDGTVLDPKGFRLPIQTNAIAAGPSGHLATWIECEDACVIKSSLLSLDAASATKPVSHETADQLSAARVAYVDGKFVVVWQKGQSYSGFGTSGAPPVEPIEIHAVRLDAQGKPIDTSPVTLNGVEGGVLAASPSRLLLFSLSSVAVIRTDPSLAIDTKTPTPISYAPVVAFGAGVFLAVWPSSSLLGMRFDEQGIAQDATPIVLHGAGSGSYGLGVAFVKGAFRVTRRWEDGAQVDIRQILVQPGGSVEAEQLISPKTSSLVWAMADGDVRAFGASVTTPISRIFHAADVSSPPLVKEPITHVESAQSNLAIASNEPSVATWVDSINDERKVVVARSSTPEFSALDWSVVLDNQPSGFVDVSPAVTRASDGSSIVAWMHADATSLETRTLAARVSGSGTLMTPTPIELAKAPLVVGNDCSHRIAAASNSNSSLIVAHSPCMNGPTLCAFSIADEGQVETRGCVWGGEPAVTTVGDDYLVSYGYGALIGVPMTAGGDLSDSYFPISGPTSVVWSPRMATDGTRVLVVWQEGVIYGALVDPGVSVPTNGQAGAPNSAAGTVIVPKFQIATNADYKSHDVVFDGSRYWVVWRGAYPDQSIYTQRFDPSAKALGSVTELFESPRSSGRLAGVRADPNAVLLGYSQLDDELGSLRLRFRRLDGASP